MARLVVLLAASILIVSIVVLQWVLKRVNDHSRSTFPAELPDRPANKLSLRKRLSQKLSTSIVNRARYSDSSRPTSFESHNPDSFPQVANDAAFHHVLMRHSTVPILARRESEPQSRFTPRGLTPRLELAFSTAPSREGNKSTFYAGVDSPHPWHQATVQQSAFIPRKPVTSKKDSIVADPLVERFERQRLPRKRQSQPGSSALAVSPLSPHLTSATSQLPPRPTVEPKAMATANVPRTSLNADPLMHQSRADNSSRRRKFPQMQPPQVEIDENTKDEFLSSEPSANVFQNGRSPARKRASPPPRRREHPSSKKIRRRSRSPIIDSSSSDGVLTPGSSEVADFPSQSEPVDRSSDEGLRRSPQTGRIGERFRDSKECAELQDILDREQYGELYIQLRAAAANSAATNLQPEKARNRASLGTHDDPIRLDSDSEASSDGAMNIDRADMSWMASNEADLTQTNIDAEFARRIQEEEASQQAGPSLRTCILCGDDHPISELPSLAACEHLPRTCAVCYAGWVAAQLQSNVWSEAKCPESECKIQLQYYEVQYTAAPEIFQQYDRYITRAAITEDPNFRWCRACDSGQIHVSGEQGNIFTCASCGDKACTVHENTWHEGETCDEYEYRSSGRKERDQKAKKPRV